MSERHALRSLFYAAEAGVVGGLAGRGVVAMGNSQRVVVGVGHGCQPTASAANTAFAIGGAGGVVGGAVAVVVGAVPVGAPMPRIACDVVESKPIWRIGFNGRESEKSIVSAIASRERALPVVGLILLVGHQLVSPGVAAITDSGPGSKFVFGFGGQPLASPGGVGRGVIPRNMHNRIVFSAHQRAVWAFGMLPVCTLHLLPSAREGIEHARFALPLGGGLVAGLLNEFGKLAIGNRCFVEPEGANLDCVGRSLVGGGRARTAHNKSAAGDVDHAGRGFDRRRGERFAAGGAAFEMLQP